MKKIAISLLVGLMLVGMIQSVMALEGPVQSPLLGVSVSDSDTGDTDNKEQWGREGGRTFGFTVYQASEYDQLKWRPVNVGIAFDGTINAALESLSYNSIVDGKAVWVGQTQVEVLNEATETYQSRTVDTEFILTVKDASDSLVPFVFMDGIPTVDLKALTPNAADEVLFTATLEMRARMPSYSSTTGICPYSSPEPIAGDFYPALNVYDCLHTNPADVRPAITMFDAGFFYEIEIPSFGLAEHDAHMEDLVGGVQTTVDDIYMQTDYLYYELPGRISNLKTGQTQISDMWTDFLYNDWPGLIGLISDLSTANTQISGNLAIMGGTLDNVFATVNEINTKVDSLGGDTGEDGVLDKLDAIDEGVRKIPDFVLLMFGLTDFIQDEELRDYWDAVQSMSPLYQRLDDLYQKLDALNEMITGLESSMGLYTQEQLDQTVANAVAAKDQKISQLSDQITSMYTQEQLDQTVANAVAAKDQEISQLIAAIAPMYTQEQLDQAIVDACPGKSEYPGQDPPEKKQSCIEEITIESPAGEEITAIGDEVGHPNTEFVDSEENSVKIHTSCSKCIYVGQEVDGWTITEIVDDGTLADKCSK